MKKDEYLEIKAGNLSAPTYIKVRSITDLGEINAVIFDCDGVLIDVRESYDIAVNETTKRIIGAITGRFLPNNIINEDTLFSFRKTGGFNNDWDLTYAIIMYVLSSLPEDVRQKIEQTAESVLNIEDVFERFKFMKVTPLNINIEIPDLKKRLIEFALTLDETGTESVDNQLLEKVGKKVKIALGHPSGVGDGIIPTLFEQLLSGPELFEETFLFPPKFEIGKAGLVERERIILVPDTLTYLSDVISSSKFGIASGSKRGTAEYVLGEILTKFNQEARIWMDDVDEAIRETGISNLSKPHPFSLLRASKPLEPFQKLLYVGDSVADLTMTLKTRENDPRFLFAGVYFYAASSDAMRDEFMRGGADIITPSVNELPIILEKIRGEYE
jgi:phosphoglycolate phosphatase-like HAD superfamily hydrolase